MRKPLPRKCYQQVRFGILISFILCLVLLSLNYSTPSSATVGVNLFLNVPNRTKDSCSGRYIFIHDDLPAKFNYDFITNCKSVSAGTRSSNVPSICPHLENSGLGPEIGKSEGVLGKKGWFMTNSYLLEVIFHKKMKKYECLTTNSTLASAIYVPLYTGMDVSVHLWDSDLTIRDSSAKSFANWLSGQPEWKKMWGKDHFFVTGRTAWDFRRETDNNSGWGSKLRFLPESFNMTMLSVEGSTWKNDISIPYPTSFHPAKDSQVVQWQKKLREQERSYLFAFVGAPRPRLQTSMRGKLIAQCQASTDCKFLHCGEKDCKNPATVMKVFKKSVYCLQPSGDSYTRRSAFDTILAGCIPVFFHPATAYTEYVWHLPKNHTKYSVFIPVRDAKDLKEGMIEKMLLGMSKDRELEMREEVIRLIPKVVYADPRSRLKTQDAIDLAVQGILERIENVRRVIGEGRDPGRDFADIDSDKVTFPEAQN